MHMSNAIDLSGTSTAPKLITVPCHDCLAPVTTNAPETTHATRCCAHKMTIACECCDEYVLVADIISVSQYAYAERIRCCEACVTACADDAGVDEDDMATLFATFAEASEDWGHLGKLLAGDVWSEVEKRRDAIEAARCGYCGELGCSCPTSDDVSATDPYQIGAGE